MELPGILKQEEEEAYQNASASVPQQDLITRIHNSAGQFSSVHDGIYALGEAHLSDISPTLPLKQFQCLIDDGPLPSFQGRLFSTSSFKTLFQVIDVVMALDVYVYVCESMCTLWLLSRQHGFPF